MMPKRVQSPSSINTFKQCQRKYYYHYIEDLPTSASIHTVRGNIAHSALEHFYETDCTEITKENYRKSFRIALQNLFIKEWGNYRKELQDLNLTTQELQNYFDETLSMLFNWCDQFLERFTRKITDNETLQETFKNIAPQTELQLHSENLGVRGFVDAVLETNGEINIIDYKTNKRAQLKDSIKLQLAIYCLMYEEKFGVRPKRAGAFFLRDTLHMMEINQDILNHAKFEIEQIHKHTEENEHILAYKRTITPLCKWRTGQCDFYTVCKPHG